jgi:hypothetical protein
MYGLLKKSKIFGDSPLINAVVSLSIAFMIFGFPVIAGISLATPLSTFFTQATVWILVLFVGFVFASLFYPDLTKMLLKAFTRRTTLGAMIVLGITLFIVSGLFNTVFIPPTKPTPSGVPAGTPVDVITIVAGVLIFVVLLTIAMAVVRR